MQKSLKVIAMMAVAGVFLLAGDAFAAEGRSAPWQMWFQPAMSPTAEGIHSLHDIIFFVEVAICIFVLLVMGFILLRFNAKANPVPSKFTHHTMLEVVWTAIPIVILVIIAVPSLKLLYFADSNKDHEMTVKVIGNQWFWSYGYPDSGIEFDSYRIDDADLEEGQPRLLAVDNALVLPVNTNVRLLMTSNDVIHNWAVPSLGIKIDTTPGRTNETWVNVNEPGDYYGMCSELCGVQHGFMPVHVKALSKADYAKWLVTAKEEFASNDNVKVAGLNTEPVSR